MPSTITPSHCCPPRHRPDQARRFWREYRPLIKNLDLNYMRLPRGNSANNPRTCLRFSQAQIMHNLGQPCRFALSTSYTRPLDYGEGELSNTPSSILFTPEATNIPPWILKRAFIPPSGTSIPYAPVPNKRSAWQHAGDGKPIMQGLPWCADLTRVNVYGFGSW